jgi:hypothetical protein
MDHLIGNDNRMRRLLEEVLVYKYILYANVLLYFLYVEERKLRNQKILVKPQLLLSKENDSW